MAVDKQPHSATGPVAEEDALVGRTIGGRYRVVGTVGFGGMGRVYDAVQSPLDRHVAIKVLLGGHAHDASFRRRFMLEAAVTSKLTHPNTVTLFDYGETDGIYFIAMELLKGRTLSDVVRHEGAIAQERAIHIAQQICRSLSEAHAQGVIHRDLKPANVMLLQQRHELDFAKVLDFGLVKFFTDGTDGQTQTGTFVGTPHYVSPEQARDEQPDPRSDIYSLGILMYLMLTGQVPFHASSAVEVLVKQLNEKPVPLRARRPDLNIDPDLEALVLRCMSKQRDQRVQSMDDLLSELTQLRARLVSQQRAAAQGPDPLQGISPAGLLNPTPPLSARSRPSGASLRGTPAGSVPLASISHRGTPVRGTPQPVSSRVPHSVPPTPALVHDHAAVLPKKRGPGMIVAAVAVVLAALLGVGAAYYLRVGRAGATRTAGSHPAIVQTMELHLRRPAHKAAPAPDAAASQRPAAIPAVSPGTASAAGTAGSTDTGTPPASTPADGPAAAGEPEKTAKPAEQGRAPAAAPRAAKTAEPPAPAVVASAIGGLTAPPPTLPISTRPRDVPAALLQTQTLSSPMPKPPEWFRKNFARQTLQAVYRICIGTDGRIADVKVVNGLSGAGVDEDLVKQIKETWTYRPQLMPLCAESRFVFRM